VPCRVENENIIPHSIKQTANRGSIFNSQSINKNSELTLGLTSNNETNEKTFLQAMVFTGIPMDEINNFYITYKTQIF
jgi:hypothetical protein